jgi:hypothetical protein
MGRWLKKLSETGGVLTDKADKAGSVSFVSTPTPHIQNPQPPVVRLAQNPDDLLAGIAAMLQAEPSQLRALLSADDLHDIAHGHNSRAYMLDYFRQMRTDGKLPNYKSD